MKRLRQQSLFSSTPDKVPATDQLVQQHHIERHYLTASSWVSYATQVLPIDDSAFASLWQLHPRRRDRMQLFGKTVTLPRFQALYGDNVVYRFSGSALQSQSVRHPVLQQVLTLVNQLEADFTYNGMLVNWYRDGNDYVGPHADDEHDLVAQAPIYSFSFGATRVFRFIHNQSKEKTDFMLDDGSMLAMGGDLQKEFKHALPKALRVKERRINVTVRAFKQNL